METVSTNIIWSVILTNSLIAPHGGYQVSAIATTAQKHFDTTLTKYKQPHSFNIHVIFLRPMVAGKAQLEVKDLKLGPGVSTIHVNIIQGGKDRVAAYVS